MSCEMWECGTIRQRKARKHHTCCECGGTIQKGEKYIFASGVWDGEGMSFRTCVDCDELRKEAEADIDDPEDCAGFGELISTMDGHHFVKLMDIRVKRSKDMTGWMRKMYDKLKARLN